MPFCKNTLDEKILENTLSTNVSNIKNRNFVIKREDRNQNV